MNKANEIIKTANEIQELLKNSKLKENLLKYEIVRLQGRYNMLDTNAIKVTGLAQNDYEYIINNYHQLMDKFPDVRDRAIRQLDYIKSANICKTIALKGCKNCIEIVSTKLDVTENDLCEYCKNIITNQ